MSVEGSSVRCGVSRSSQSAAPGRVSVALALQGMSNQGKGKGRFLPVWEGMSSPNEIELVIV